MLSLSNVARTFGGQTVLRDVTFQVTAGEKVGLVGANGTGKSTILKIVVGEIESDAGRVAIATRMAIGYLPQVNHLRSGLTLHEEMVGVFAEVNALERRQRDIEAAMQGCPESDPRLPALLEEYGQVLHEFEQADGYMVEAKIGQVLGGLGFQPEDAQRPVEEFSGGWQMRAALAKLLLACPTLLLLDEPTNHLDLRAVEWLEDYLRDYKGAVIVVSHDRYFLDRVTQRTLELTSGGITDYAGNYSFYFVEKEKRQEVQMAAFRRQQAELEKQESFINRFRAKATKASQVKSREKMLERLERVEAPDGSARSMKLHFPAARPSGREAIVFKNLGKSYGDKVVFQGGELAIERGDCVALIGPNGSGKSTLLKILAGVEQPSTGAVHLGHNVILSYFAQDQAGALDAAHTAIDEIYEAAPIETTLTDVRAVLGRFLITGDEGYKRIGQLSGGERSRVALAKMLLRPANVLLLDEPTNHLDLGSIEALEEALESFQGVAMVVSHDRRFLDRVATKVVEVDDGKLTLYLGNYSYYHEKKRAVEAARAMPEPPRQKQPPKPAPTIKNAATIAKRKAADMERRITELEESLAAVEADLGQPELYQDYERAAELARQHAAVKEEIERLTEEWLLVASTV